MSSRKKLLSFLGTLTVIAMLFVGYILLSSLSPSERTKNESTFEFAVSSFKPGQLQVQNLRGYPVFFLRPTNEQWNAIQSLDPHVRDQSLTGYVKEADVFVYLGFSTNFGCELQHQPPGSSVLSNMYKEATWAGGFWSTRCELSYDYAGRLISTWNKTFNGLSGPFPNLPHPNSRLVGDQLVVVLDES